jgi:hypothetical protein
LKFRFTVPCKNTLIYIRDRGGEIFAEEKR